MSLDQLKMPTRPKPVVLQPEIATERFVLRPLRRSDAGLISLYSSDERVARMTTSIPHPLPPGATEAFIAAGFQAGDSLATAARDGGGAGR